ncbi:MAG: bifunctional riboflavin kinase/FAD synthetase [Bacteroidales bacterium]
MKIYEDISGFRGSEFPVVTVGTFDGLHIGHQKIIRRMKEIARQNNGDTILITFEPHPRQVLGNGNGNLKFISTRKRKMELLAHFGIDHMIIIPFTKEFAQTSSEEFVKNYLADILRTRFLVVGYDHHFGRGRSGDYDQLRLLGRKHGFEVEEISACMLGDIPVSSTKIRQALNEGDIALANRMLGYAYSITGKVVQGNHIGTRIGFPTANIECEDQFKLIARGGVYACRIETAMGRFNGMGNIGFRPTIGGSEQVTEVHLFDFEGNLYGQEITIFFIDRIRDEIKFRDLEALRNQLVADEKKARTILGTSPY